MSGGIRNRSYDIDKHIKARRQSGEDGCNAGLTRSAKRLSDAEFAKQRNAAIAQMGERKGAATQFAARDTVHTNDNKSGVVDRVDPKTGSVLVRLRTGRIVPYTPSALTKQ